MRNKILLPIPLLAVLLAASPAQAQSFVETIGGIAGGVLKSETGVDINPYVSTAQSLFSDLQSGDIGGAIGTGVSATGLISETDGSTASGGETKPSTLGTIGNIGQILVGVLGAAGVPVPDEFREIFHTQVLESDQGGGSFGVNKASQASTLTSLAEIRAGKEANDLTLSEKGQQIIADKRAAVGEATAANAQLSVEAGEQRASIDIDKLQAQQLALLHQGQEATYDEAVQTRLELTKGNQVNLGLFEAAQQRQWAEQVEVSAGQVGVITAGSEFAGLMDRTPQEQ